mgnify:CR=1 FL=1|jgi:hypothetical protein
MVTVRDITMSEITAETMTHKKRADTTQAFIIKLCNKNHNYADIMYGEKARYMINIPLKECTCRGFMFTHSCKHVKALNSTK